MKRQIYPLSHHPVAGPALSGWAWLASFIGAGLLFRRRASRGPAQPPRPTPGATQLLAVLYQAGLGIVQVGLDGRLLSLDARCRAMLGVGPHWAAGRCARELCAPEDHAAVRVRFTRLIRTGEPFETVQRLARRDGGEIWVHGSVSLVRNSRGRPQSVLAVVRDVTEQRAADIALRADLEAARAERVRLEHGLRGSQRMEMLGQLTGGVAHDFNNVLQAIAGGARLIQRHAQEPRMVAQLTGLVVEAAEHGAFVTQRLLAFARRGPLAPEPVDIPVLLSGMRGVLERTLGTDVSVSLDAPPGLPPALADKGQLEAVLVNLATNAREAIVKGAARGGGCRGSLVLSAVAERVEPGSPHLSGLAAGAYVRLAAVDTGIGMAPADLARVTEPFFTTKPLTRGTGLSLAMARGFVEQSGGRIAVESVLGQGTTVTLWLPQVEAVGDRR